MSSSLSIINYQLSIINDHVENLRANSFQQGEDDVPMEGHVDDHANKLPKPKDVEEMLRAIWNHQEGQELPYSGPLNWGSNFVTLIT